ncbi:MAG TPA: hypothetical protein PJ982_11375, partial [Lacipirellulaceae bacterium]|nr:hypothetical protein [Lacipirellulaceae bacterium]
MGSDIVIGGGRPGAGNLISGFGTPLAGNNHGIGLRLASDSSGIQIFGNRIGTTADGLTPLGNGGAGVFIS